MATSKSSKKKGSPSKKPAKKSKKPAKKVAKKKVAKKPSAKAKSKRTGKKLTEAQKYQRKMMALSNKQLRAGGPRRSSPSGRALLGGVQSHFGVSPGFAPTPMGGGFVGLGGPSSAFLPAPKPARAASRGSMGMTRFGDDDAPSRRPAAPRAAASPAAAAAVSAMADQCKDVIGKLEKSQRKVAKLESDLKEARKRKRAGAKPTRKPARKQGKPGKGARATVRRQAEQKAKRPQYQSVEEALKARVRGALIKGHPGTKKCKVCGKAHKASQCWSHVAGLGGRGPKGYVAKRSGR